MSPLPDTPARLPILAVVGLVALQAVALLVASGRGLVDAVAGRAEHVGPTVAMALVFAGVAVVLAFVARALVRGSGAAWAGLVVWHVPLIMTFVGIARSTGEPLPWAVTAVAVVAVVLLLLPPVMRHVRRNRRQQPEAGPGEGSSRIF